MDVLVCATQVPHMRGGLEQLVEGLVVALEAAGHRAEAVRIPAAWDRERLLDAPLAWRSVPLDADVVIPVNFPAYYARHPRKVVWLAHQHRAAYDGIGQAWSDIGLDDDSLEVQRQLTAWDTRALDEAVARFTISGVVSDRMARFCGLDSEPLHHPPPLADRLAPSPLGDRIVSIGRLEANKRPALLLDALGAASTDVAGVLAGRGSQADALATRAAAAGLDGRLEMPGYVSDDAVVDLLGDALAVLYAPYDEDYGYVTLQAFLAGRPVITTADAGGVLEWVTDGETGIVTDGSPEELGAAVDRLAGDRELAARMGAAGRERADALGWPEVVERLLGAAG
ncbi:glycosyltransferase family 4 protein [Iamia majanohamensis]|uniref:Glycosyltransferase family 4 protein n=1 Tax=Iamia majanohamensis TaxID=467976 RepID=A0AAE9Y3Z3_9ACTN|nr:glycosyltransferase family 4 protein [Iamia majanohamensis]WCO65505.1 glycosyltransferase family 4 protein [Iamia majanohamensis]